MSLKKSKCFSKNRAYDEAAKSDSSMFPPCFEKLKNICISDAASCKYTIFSKVTFKATSIMISSIF